MQSDLGVTVPGDAEGCLQDIHWSFGAVGYFPSYTLGAMIAVQIYGAAAAALGEATLREQISRGEFAPLREWLRANVHEAGSVPGSPDALLQGLTGGGVSPQPFLRYLRQKYSQLYELPL